MNGPCGSFRCFKENTATTAFWWTAPWLWRQPGCSEQSRVAVTARPILYRRQFCLIKPWMHFPLLPSMFLRMTVSFRILKNKLFLPNRDVFFVCPPGLEWPDVVSGHWTSCFLFFFCLYLMLILAWKSIPASSSVHEPLMADLDWHLVNLDSA